jgi:DNA polymerase-3 subunit beta
VEKARQQLVQVAMRPNDCIFQTDRVFIYTRLVEGRYPPYQSIIDQAKKQVKHKIPLTATVFLQKVRQASVMTDDESKRLDMAFADGVCTLSAKGAELGSSHVEMPVDFTGSAKIAFDPSFVVSMLRNAKGTDTVVMVMADESKPALFHCGEGLEVLIMPLAG